MYVSVLNRHFKKMIGLNCFWSLYRKSDVPFLYLRRNLPGDRAKALDIMIPLVQNEEQVASDMYCLVGRIYKDMFLDSNFMDTESRDHGASW